MKRMLFIVGLFGLMSCASGMDEFQTKKEASVEADSIPNISGVAEDTVPHAYIPMLIPGNQWIERVQYRPSISRHQIIELGNDTIIEGIKYTQLMEYNRELPPLGDTSVYISYIREDITNQQIFHKFDGWPEELLYDFQVQVGDVVGEDEPVQVQKIDFVEIGSILRKRITLSYDIIYIEGIGRLKDGLICGMQDFGVGVRITLVSFSQNGVVVYPESATGIPQISLSRRK
ncbi:hypothetical protein AGMMS49525_11810 [Bacteroidia bacterium]|nr:hypothetical protein AGMMS49525_11810 [Bacteroidia bacterium]